MPTVPFRLDEAENFKYYMCSLNRCHSIIVLRVNLNQIHAYKMPLPLQAVEEVTLVPPLRGDTPVERPLITPKLLLS